ncbi:MAG: winged helix-turn-helix transcriptional regulator [Bacteroidetes bacterium]|nr:winged helix-turn-helix transcriptional regulator [Bacteroidota bacterium]
MSFKVTPYTEKQEKLARYAKALSHPARVYILRFLDTQCACYVGNIVDELPMAQSSVSQHLKELKNAGLIQGTVEPPKIKYCINRSAWEEAKKLFENYFQKKG